MRKIEKVIPLNTSLFRDVCIIYSFLNATNIFNVKGKYFQTRLKSDELENAFNIDATSPLLPCTQTYVFYNDLRGTIGFRCLFPVEYKRQTPFFFSFPRILPNFMFGVLVLEYNNLYSFIQHLTGVTSSSLNCNILHPHDNYLTFNACY